MPIKLTKEQVSSSPDIDTDKPISLQHERQLFDHYPWRNYWEDEMNERGVWNMMYPTSPINNEVVENAEPISDTTIKADHNLRSTGAITGYYVHATDGDIGHVKDFIMDDQSGNFYFLLLILTIGLAVKKY